MWRTNADRQHCLWPHDWQGSNVRCWPVFSVRYLLSPVRLFVVCNVRVPYSGGWNFRKYVYVFGTLAMRWRAQKTLRRSSQENPSAGGVKHKRGLSNIAILDLSKAISQKRCNIGGKLVLITNRKSYKSFQLVPKSVTFNDLERRNVPYSALFHRIR